MIGHASLLIQLGGFNILVDPVWSERASPVGWAGPARFNAPGVAFEDLPAIDAVLLTHNHYDHLDMPTLQRLWHAHRPLIVAPLGNDRIVTRSLPQAVVEVLDWDQPAGLGQDLTVWLVPANHWSSRRITDRRMALWGGFFMKAPGGSVYIAGDTGYGDGSIFQHIRSRHGAPDAAILPIGAYAPRWFMQDQHINPAEAVRIMHDCGAAQALGVHWGTFQLTDEPQYEPKEELQRELARLGISEHRFIAMQPGDAWPE